MALTSTQVRELAELESMAAEQIRRNLPNSVGIFGTPAFHANNTCNMRSQAFMEIAENMDNAVAEEMSKDGLIRYPE